MKRKDWLLVAAVLLVCVVIDQLTKLWAPQLSETNYGYLKFLLVHNHGAMLGLFSDLPAVLRIVTLSTSGVFILCIYCLLQYLIPGRMLSLRLSLSVLVGGIIGNVLDRIFYGYVIDFICIETATWHSPIWNMADVIQWLGYLMMVYSLFKYSGQLWPDQNARKTFWINRKFQLKHSVLFMITGLFLTLVSAVFSYTYLRVSLQEVAGYNPLLIDKFTQPFLVTFFILALMFALLLFSVGKLMSHRIAGPIYAFERFLKDILEGRGLTKSGAALQLRNNDDLRHLEELAEQVRARLVEIKAQQNVQVTEYHED